MGKIRVIIADDHAIMRVGIRNILTRSSEINVVGEASNGAEAIELVKEYKPDVLILDMEMPIMDGVEVARRLKGDHSPVKILVLSAYDDRQYILEMLEMGASGYLIKDEAPEVIVDAVQRIAAGEKGWISRKAALRVHRPDFGSAG
jgi:two-component system, NarL family, response regulator DegU